METSDPTTNVASTVPVPPNKAEPKWLRVLRQYRSDPSFYHLLEILFKIEERGSTVLTEINCGLIQFLSVAGVLAINPAQLAFAGYNKEHIAAATAIGSSATCILTGLLANLPFVSTPTLATSIYLSVFMKSNGLSLETGNMITLIFGVLMMICSIKEVIDFLTLIIPSCIKYGICIGLSLVISVQALSHLHIVVIGTYTLLALGDIWNPEVTIAIMSFLIIAVLIHFKVKGAYIAGLAFGSIAFWLYSQTFPRRIYAVPSFMVGLNITSLGEIVVWRCIGDMFLLGAVLLAGLSSSLSSIAKLERANGSPPRRRWLYFACGLGTIIGSALGCGPILLNAESTPALMAGAKTGLSTIVCGFLFLLSSITYPLWASIPMSGTAPVILMVGVVLFENTGKVNWHSIKDSIVVYITAIFSAFTYSIFHGVTFGFGIYVVLSILTGDIMHLSEQLFISYDAYQSETSDVGEHLYKYKIKISSADSHKYQDLELLSKELQNSIGNHGLSNYRKKKSPTKIPVYINNQTSALRTMHANYHSVSSRQQSTPNEENSRMGWNNKRPKSISNAELSGYRYSNHADYKANHHRVRGLSSAAMMPIHEVEKNLSFSDLNFYSSIPRNIQDGGINEHDTWNVEQLNESSSDSCTPLLSKDSKSLILEPPKSPSI